MALDSVTIAARGLELTGLDVFRTKTEETAMPRILELMTQMQKDIPLGGQDIQYRDEVTQYLRYWPGSSGCPIVIFIHGGSWRIGTNLDSVGSAKIEYLNAKGYAFASINYTLIPKVTVQRQIREIAKAIKYLDFQAESLGFDSKSIALMGHSSGAHVATLLGTDTSYLEDVGLAIQQIRGVIALDGSNYNALAELIDNPGNIADNMLEGLGDNVDHLRIMSPTYHAQGSNAGAFLLLHVARSGDIRQAVELCATLKAAWTEAALHVFEGGSYEGHVQMLLRLGRPDYPATIIMEHWLQQHAPTNL